MLLASVGSLFGQATHITATSGGGQWATEKAAYESIPVAGVTANFSGPGIASISGPTDSNGNLSVCVTANSIPGGKTVTASIPGSPQIMTTFGLMVGASGACAQSNIVTSTADSNAVGTLREAVYDLCPGGTVDHSQSPNNSVIMLAGRIYLSQDIILKGPTNGNTGYSTTTYAFTIPAGGMPIISNVVPAPASGNTASIRWATSVPTYSYVQHGTSSGAYYCYSAQTSLTTTPNCILGYVPSGTVYYQLVSTDAIGNQVVSPEATFVEP